MRALLADGGGRQLQVVRGVGVQERRRRRGRVGELAVAGDTLGAQQPFDLGPVAGAAQDDAPRKKRRRGRRGGRRNRGEGTETSAGAGDAEGEADETEASEGDETPAAEEIPEAVLRLQKLFGGKITKIEEEQS